MTVNHVVDRVKSNERTVKLLKTIDEWERKFYLSKIPRVRRKFNIIALAKVVNKCIFFFLVSLTKLFFEKTLDSGRMETVNRDPGKQQTWLYGNLQNMPKSDTKTVPFFVKTVSTRYFRGRPKPGSRLTRWG